MDADQLLAFDRIVREGSFSRAAQGMDISQPTISARIRTLEAAVGGALFHLSPLQPGQTMTAAMAALSFGSDQVAGSAAAFQSLYFVGALLFVMTLGLNVLGDKLVSRVREVY